MRKILISILILLPCLVFAVEETSTNFVEGKDYTIIPAKPGISSTTLSSKVKVIEFFSLGCPWCYRLESELGPWLKDKPKNIDFERVPVTFNENWVLLAKAYYAAKALGVADTLMPVLFKAIQEDKMQFTNANELADFFEKYDVNKDEFLSAFNFSPAIDAHISRGQGLIREYGIVSVPTIVIDGKYRTDSAMVNGDMKRFIEVVKYLINKVPLKA